MPGVLGGVKAGLMREGGGGLAEARRSKSDGFRALCGRGE